MTDLNPEALEKAHNSLGPVRSLYVSIVEAESIVRAYIAALPAGDVGTLTEPLSMSMFISPNDMISRLLHDRREAASALTAMQRERDDLKLRLEGEEAAYKDGFDHGFGEANMVKNKRAEAAEAEVARLKDELAEDHRVIEPFAKAADNFDDFKIANPNEWFAYGGISSANSDREGAITVGDLRRARSFRDGQKTGEKG